jgi:Zn-dependent protease
LLLSYLDILTSDPAAWLWFMVAGVVGIVSAVTVHEAGHAWSAMRLGDRTAYLLGRVSLDPRRHLDPAGSLLFLIAGFGWGKPTPVTPQNLRGDPRTGMGLVSVSGPVANVVTAALLAVPFRLGLLDWQFPFTLFGVPGSGPVFLADILSFAVFFNLLLAVFNLVPLIPLDGFKTLVALLPRGAAEAYESTARFGFMPLFVLVLLDALTPVRTISLVIGPVVNLFGEAFLGHPLI